MKKLLALIGVCLSASIPAESVLDTTPPSVSIASISQTTVLDLTNQVPFTLRLVTNNGAYSDFIGHTTNITKRWLELTYFAQSNRVYIAWWTTAITPYASNWYEHPYSYYYGPPQTNTIVFPIFKDQRFLWLRAHNQ